MGKEATSRDRQKTQKYNCSPRADDEKGLVVRCQEVLGVKEVAECRVLPRHLSWLCAEAAVLSVSREEEL